MSPGHPACEGGAQKGPGSGDPRMPQEVRHLRHAREDLVASRHLAIRDDRTRRSVEGPKDGVHAARMPWEVRPKTHLTALFEAQLIVCHECCGHKSLHETAHAHMETAWEGDIEGKGCSRLFRSRACGYRRHRQKVQPKLYQHHGRPGPPVRPHRYGRRRTKAASEMSLGSTQGTGRRV